MEVNIDDDDRDEIFRNLFEQLEGLSLPEAAETTCPWNINALFESLPPPFQEKAPTPPPQASSTAVSGVLENLDQLMGPEYLQDTTVHTQDQSVQFGSNKPIIAETSKSINTSLQTGPSTSQVPDKEGLFTVPPESIRCKRSDIGAADSNQQLPRKRQRR